MNDSELDIIRAEIAEIKERNQRVERDKAWEISRFRQLLLVGITYISTSVVFYFIDVKEPLLNALIPTVGYFLSVQSLPLVKAWWIKRKFGERAGE